MTWHCETHGPVTPDHYGASYRCPKCTARTVWRESERSMSLKEGIKQLRAIGGWKGGEPPTFREQMEGRYGSWEEYQRLANQSEEDA